MMACEVPIQVPEVLSSTDTEIENVRMVLRSLGRRRGGLISVMIFTQRTTLCMNCAANVFVSWHFGVFCGW